MAINVAVSVALLPALFGIGGASASDDATVVSARGSDAAPTVTEAPTTTTMPPTTTTVPPTTVPPTTAAPSTTIVRAVAKVAAPPTTVRRVVAATPTTAKPAPRPTTTTTAAPVARPASGEPAASGQEGKATYYEGGGGPGTCAHRTLPFGTVVTVTAISSGKTVRCRVADRGPFVNGYVIDLDPVEFEQLAPRSAGVVNVRLTW